MKSNDYPIKVDEFAKI